jgi:hypothetical protein
MGCALSRKMATEMGLALVMKTGRALVRPHGAASHA